MSIDKQSRTEIIELVVGMFDGAPGAQYLSELMNLRANGLSLEGLAEALTQSPAFAAAYSPVLANDEFASKFVNNLLGDLVAEADKAWSADWIEAQLNAGSTKAEVIMTAISALKGAAGTEQFGAAAAALENKVEVAEWYSVEAGKSATSLEELQGVLAGVTNDPATVEAAKGDDSGSTGDNTLTQQADNVSGDAEDNIFLAPITQNETGSGELANTFETGDVIKGGAGNDTLKASLIATGTISDDGNGVAISAETDSVENVFLRAQSGTEDDEADNTTSSATVDAENMAGVEQWWSDNSRADLVIEDIRNNTSEVTFGMRQTDPSVDYDAYFNPMYLEGDTSATSAMTLNIYEGDSGEPSPNELANITVYSIEFTVDDTLITLESDAIEAANTWDELEEALNAELLELGVSDSISLTNLGNGQFVFEDNEGRVFEVKDGEALVLSVASNLTVTNSLMPGREEIAGPTITNVVLDAAGNGSEGGDLNIGAMSGGRGVEVFNVTVDRDSHLTSMSSVNGAQFNGLVPNEYLQVVNLENGSVNGNLQVGERTDTLDMRAAVTGLTNVREINAAGFEGDLNIGFRLTDNAIARYLDPATEQVEFNYTAGNGNDLFNFADASTNDVVSQDEDFAMNIDMGAGDDRLVLDIENVNDTTVDGGTGQNSIVVSRDHGTDDNNTFAGFENFQTYEIEGDGSTHNFTSMQGVEDVIVATNGGLADNTQLINMEAEQSVTVSGKNQTIGNNSTSDQTFGNIQLTNDQGTERTVTLDNTARLANTTNGVRIDGVLTVDTLTLDSDANEDGVSNAVRELTIASTGERSTANAIEDLTAADVESLLLTGTQDLSLNVESLANQTPATAQTALDIDASDLTGNLSLAIDGDQLNSIAGTGTDTVVGTDGDNDTLMLHGAIAAGNELNATEFEALQFGTQANTLFGDLALGGAAIGATGTFNAASVTANVFNVANIDGAGTLTLDNIGTGSVVNLGDANRDNAGAVVNGQSLDGTLVLISGADDDTAAARATSVDVNFLSNLQEDDTQALEVEDFGTINIDIAKTGEAHAVDARVLNLTLDNDARTLNISGGDVDGDNTAGNYDTLNLNGVELPNSVSTIDLSQYAGEVTLTMQQGAIVDADETDVLFVMSENNANITLSNEAIADTAHNSKFEFTADKGDTADVSTWTITGAHAFGNIAGTTENATILDLRDLGIGGYDELDILANGGNARIISEAQNDDGAVTWEIILTGVDSTEVVEENFIFA